MTSLTFQPPVLASEWKICRSIMIEAPEIPGIRIVAVSTARPQGLLVLVVLCVAINTGSRGVVETLVVVTFPAAGNHVHPQ